MCQVVDRSVIQLDWVVSICQVLYLGIIRDRLTGYITCIQLEWVFSIRIFFFNPCGYNDVIVLEVNVNRRRARADLFSETQQFVAVANLMTHTINAGYLSTNSKVVLVILRKKNLTCSIILIVVYGHH